jgi:hypothetical protein
LAAGRGNQPCVSCRTTTWPASLGRGWQTSLHTLPDSFWAPSGTCGGVFCFLWEEWQETPPQEQPPPIPETPEDCSLASPTRHIHLQTDAPYTHTRHGASRSHGLFGHVQARVHRHIYTLSTVFPHAVPTSTPFPHSLQLFSLMNPPPCPQTPTPPTTCTHHIQTPHTSLTVDRTLGFFPLAVFLGL